MIIKIGYMIGNILFFLMLMFPYSHQNIKKPLVVLVVLIILLPLIVNKYSTISKKILLWYIVLISYGLFWTLLAIINGNPGAMGGFRLNVIWVFLFGIYTLGIRDEEHFNSLVKTIVYSSLAISLYNILALLSVLGYLPFDIIKLVNVANTRIGLHPGYVHLTSSNIATLLYTGPFLIALFIYSKKKTLLGFNKLLAVSMLLTVIVVFLSGRRSLLLVFFMMPIILIYFDFFVKAQHKMKKKIIKCLILMCLLMAFCSLIIMSYSSWDVNNYIDRFTEAFEISDNNVRLVQHRALMDGFQKHPVIGTGFGKGVDSYVRSATTPWVYELSYSLQLYNVGIIGATIYILCVLWLYYESLKLMFYRNDRETVYTGMAVLSGMTCFLVANATNPYSYTYDFMWPLFLTAAFINSRKSKKTNAS